MYTWITNLAIFQISTHTLPSSSLTLQLPFLLIDWTQHNLTAVSLTADPTQFDCSVLNCRPVNLSISSCTLLLAFQQSQTTKCPYKTQGHVSHSRLKHIDSQVNDCGIKGEALYLVYSCSPAQY